MLLKESREMEEEKKEGKKVEKKGLKKRHIVAIIVAVIGALAIIIVALIPKEINLKVYIQDAATEKNIPGNIFIDNDRNPTTINAADGTIVTLKQGKYVIRAESEGYHQNTVVIDRLPNPLVIPLEQIAVISDGPIPLSFVGWRPWNNEITLRQGAAPNEIIIHGATDDATGFSNTDLPPVLRGRTLILYFSNTRASNFSRNRMVKLEYNRNDTLLRPTNASLVNREYLPDEDTPLNNGIEFPIPDDFNGKLNFVFYQAELNDLRITAYYR